MLVRIDRRGWPRPSPRCAPGTDGERDQALAPIMTRNARGIVAMASLYAAMNTASKQCSAIRKCDDGTGQQEKAAADDGLRVGTTDRRCKTTPEGRKTTSAWCRTWCGWLESNQRPLASEANTLSTELQPHDRRSEGYSLSSSTSMGSVGKTLASIQVSTIIRCSTAHAKKPRDRSLPVAGFFN